MLEKVKMSSVEERMKMVFSHCNVPLFLRTDVVMTRNRPVYIYHPSVLSSVALVLDFSFLMKLTCFLTALLRYLTFKIICI